MSLAYSPVNVNPVNIGPAVQAHIPFANTGLSASIDAAGNSVSSVLSAAGFQAISMAFVPSQNGTLSVQRYLDAAGTIVTGAALTATLTATVAALLNIAADGVPFQSFIATITNSGGSPMTLTQFALLMMNPQAASSSGGSSSTAVYSAGVTETNRSGTITVGGTAQSLMGANASRKGFSVQNNSAGNLWINEIGGTAVQSQPSLLIAPGALYENPVNGVSVAAISIIGPNTGQTFTAREW